EDGIRDDLVTGVQTCLFRSDRPVAEEFRNRGAGIAEVLDGCRTAGQLLAERVGRMDADAYRFWLVAIATRVCHAARTGSTLGFRSEEPRVGHSGGSRRAGVH